MVYQDEGATYLELWPDQSSRCQVQDKGGSQAQRWQQPTKVAVVTYKGVHTFCGGQGYCSL